MFSHNGEAKVPARQNLVKKYLPIGPAAIAAAVAAMEKRKTGRNRPTGQASELHRPGPCEPSLTSAHMRRGQGGMSSFIGGLEWALALALVFLVAVIAHRMLGWLRNRGFSRWTVIGVFGALAGMAAVAPWLWHG